MGVSTGGDYRSLKPDLSRPSEDAVCLGAKPVRSKGRGDVAEALEEMRDKALAGQVNRAQSAISHFLGWSVDLRKLDINDGALIMGNSQSGHRVANRRRHISRLFFVGYLKHTFLAVTVSSFRLRVSAALMFKTKRESLAFGRHDGSRIYWRLLTWIVNTALVS